MAIDPQTYLIAFGIIILIAFLGHVMFQRTKMPDVILLIFLGTLLGPLFPRLPGNPDPLLDPVIFNQLLPLLAAVAIIIILFDGGLKLNIKDLFVGVAPATILTVLGFLASMFLVAGILRSFGVVERPEVALIFGAIVGGTSSVVVMPIVEKMSVQRQTKTVVGLESALTDVLVVVVAITLSVGVATATINAEGLLQELAANFAIAIAMGLIGGFLWVRYLRMFTRRSYEYMLTLAFLFMVYASTEFLGGSGALAVLAFGLVLGNSKKQDKLSGPELAAARQRHERVHRFVPVFTIDLVNLHNEIVFFIRAFFFVALGVILDLSVFLEPRFIGVSILLVFGLIAARMWALTLTFWRSELPDRDKTAIGFLMPRGLAAAALAAVPFTVYKITDPIATVQDFVAFAVMILILTNLITSIGVYLFENDKFQQRWYEWSVRFSEWRSERSEERSRIKAQRKADRAAAAAKRREARENR